jgi:hypothetical protein
MPEAVDYFTTHREKADRKSSSLEPASGFSSNGGFLACSPLISPAIR